MHVTFLYQHVVHSRLGKQHCFLMILKSTCFDKGSLKQNRQSGKANFLLSEKYEMQDTSPKLNSPKLSKRQWPDGEEEEGWVANPQDQNHENACFCKCPEILVLI